MANTDLPADDIFHPGGRLRLDLLTDPAGQALRESLRLARETQDFHPRTIRALEATQGRAAGCLCSYYN